MLGTENTTVRHVLPALMLLSLLEIQTINDKTKIILLYM